MSARFAKNPLLADRQVALHTLDLGAIEAYDIYFDLFKRNLKVLPLLLIIIIHSAASDWQLIYSPLVLGSWVTVWVYSSLVIAQLTVCPQAWMV